MGIHGVYGRKVQTNPWSSHHLQDTIWILRSHSRMKTGSFIVIVLSENLLLLFMKHVKVNADKVESNLTS